MRLEKIWKIYLWLCLGLLLWFFNPFLVDGFGFGKQAFFLFSGFLGLLFWSLLVIRQKEAKLVWHPFLSWWLLMLTVAALSLLGKPLGVVVKSMYYPWGIGSLLGLGIWWFLGMQSGIGWLKKMVGIWLWLGVFLSVLSLVIFVLPESIWPLVLPGKNLPWLNLSTTFSFLGSLHAEVLFLLLLTLVGLQRWWTAYKSGSSYIKSGFILIFLILGLVSGGYRLSKSPFAWLDVKNSWNIGLQTMGQNPFLGLGAGNFIEGFWKYRLTSINNSTDWMRVYSASVFGWLSWMVETGLMGFLVLLLGFWWLISYRRHSSFGWLLILVAILGWVGPWFWLTQLLVGFLILGYSSNRLSQHALLLTVGNKGRNISGWLIFVMVLLTTGAGIWWLVKPIAAEYYWRLGLEAVAKNDPNGAYNWQQKAALSSPQLAEIRRSYAQTNFALAQAIMQNIANGKDKTVKDSDKQNLSVLLGQAIDEAKAAIALEPDNPNMWATLGLFYKNMVGTVDGAYDWAIQAYQQMAHVDPANPLTRVELGGMFFGAGDLETAAKVFEEAVKIKPDLPNAWYNLAHTAYLQSQAMGKESVARIGKLQQAVGYMQQAMKLVPVDSSDYEKANKELDSWNKELNGLITPTPIPSLNPMMTVTPGIN